MIERLNKTSATIMVVEDDPTTEQSLIDCLSDLGNVVTFSNAENALSFVSRGGRVDLVIADIVLGQMNGIELCERLSQQYSGDHFVPVLFYSAFADSAMERLAYQAGGVDFIEKPMSFARLQLRVRSFLAISKRFSTLRSKLEVDQTTDLMLRDVFIQRGAIQILKRLFTGATSALLVLNVAGTSKVNAEQGFEAGDKLLSDVAHCLHEVCEARGYLAARHMGDKFLVLVPDCAEEAPGTLASKLLESLSSHLAIVRQELATVEITGGGASLKHTEDLRTDRGGSANAIRQMIHLAEQQLAAAPKGKASEWTFAELTRKQVNIE
ncbi:MAG TPA: response regulator [Marinobacterium sp.]|nr:response regulator [Marinobacterium sp.]